MSKNRIPNDAGLDDASTNIELLVDLNPNLWAALCAAGYRVAMPDLIALSAPNDMCWFIEVGKNKSVAYMYHLGEQQYMGKRYQVHGAPDVAVARARHILETTAMQECLSGMVERSLRAEIEDVFA